jgi:hypothetical protein
VSELEAWQFANDAHLGAHLEWLRARLEQLASSTGSATPIEARDFSPPPDESMPAESSLRPPALNVLSRRLGLSDFERMTLLLCAAMELDTRVGALCARAQSHSGRAYPTFALALSLFERPSWDVMSPERPLRRWRLIEIDQSGSEPLITSALKASERVVSYLKGLNYIDEQLSPLVRPLEADASPLPPSQAAVAESIASSLTRANGRGRLPLFQLVGPDSQSKALVAAQAASRVGLVPYRIGVDALPQNAQDHETFVRLWQRESALLPLALYVDGSSGERTSTAPNSAVQRLLGSDLGVVFFETREPVQESLNETLVIDVAKPTPSEQREAWLAALGESHAEQALRLSGQFNFNAPTIVSIAASTRSLAEALRPQSTWNESLRRARPLLDQLAQPLVPKATWADIELPQTDLGLLRQIADQVRTRGTVYDGWGFRGRMNRGFGISVLFAGESGTGKTMAAEVIANELGLMLYRIDLSSVVSKYIGETEKNLRRLFDAAEDGGAILFFDEADALFGKRSEVKDSHDRYANIEINYLLQRMECYGGLAILATNMKAALDSAFLRRLRFVVNFAFPGATQRKAIWQKTFPRETPLGPLDYDWLAKFNLTGGSISNIVLNAAFLAARGESRVTMPHLLDAIRTEYRKLEKPINEGEFRWPTRAEASI